MAVYVVVVMAEPMAGRMVEPMAARSEVLMVEPMAVCLAVRMVRYKEEYTVIHSAEPM